MCLARVGCLEPALMLTCCRADFVLCGEPGDGYRCKQPAPGRSRRLRGRAIDAGRCVAPRALDHLVGAAVAGAGDAGDRDRPLLDGVVAGAMAVAAAAR